MTPISRDYNLYLEDMLTSMLRIEEYIGKMGFGEFKMNYLIVDAIIRNFEIIGEASKNVPLEIKNKYPEIPWKKMYGLRNLIAHEYFGIDYEMIWEISKNNLPQNSIDLRKIIEMEKSTSGNKGS
ncbi:MAG: DUF86 domain-containing protein [Bacteroidetes bacterium]|nr:DUF86 domain-containing protein [Bacteroidota bacterium]MBL7104381.1 DUF86 domain-containing protein [Bacteroidales bacterium]